MGKDVTPFQRQCAEALLQEPSGIASAAAISRRLRRREQLAVTSAMAALHRRELATCVPGEDRVVTLWTLTAKGKAELQLQRAPAAAQ